MHKHNVSDNHIEENDNDGINISGLSGSIELSNNKLFNNEGIGMNIESLGVHY